MMAPSVLHLPPPLSPCCILSLPLLCAFAHTLSPSLPSCLAPLPPPPPSLLSVSLQLLPPPLYALSSFPLSPFPHLLLFCSLLHHVAHTLSPSLPYLLHNHSSPGPLHHHNYTLHSTSPPCLSFSLPFSPLPPPPPPPLPLGYHRLHIFLFSLPVFPLCHVFFSSSMSFCAHLPIRLSCVLLLPCSLSSLPTPSTSPSTPFSSASPILSLFISPGLPIISSHLSLFFSYIILSSSCVLPPLCPSSLSPSSLTRLPPFLHLPFFSTGAKSKKGPAAAYGRGWPGGVWEEGGGGGGGGSGNSSSGGSGSEGGGSGGAVGMVSGAGGRGGKETREMYLIHFPRDEDDEEEMVEDEEGEGSLSGEGEETTNIKEEVRETGLFTEEEEEE